MGLASLAHALNAALLALDLASSPWKSSGAGEGNRTLVVSLEGFCSTIELHPLSGVRRQRSGNRSFGVSGGGALAPLETSRSGPDSTPPGARCAARETWTRLLPVFCLLIPDWWRGKDSNLRRQSRQIYSLLPLTAREPLRETRNSSSRTARASNRPESRPEPHNARLISFKSTG